MSSFTANTDYTLSEISADVDCDKCKDSKCLGTCTSKQEHKCTDDCKKEGKCTHTKAEHKCTDACKKDGNCTHKPTEKKAEAKKSCGDKKSCGNHKGCGKH